MAQKLIIPYSWQGLDFQPTWLEEETGKTIWGEKKFRIFIWGHDQFNDPCCWIIENMTPYGILEIRQDYPMNPQFEVMMIQALNRNLLDYVQKRLKANGKGSVRGLDRLKNIIVGFVPEDKTRFFYYNPQKYRTYKIYFNLEEALKLCTDYLSRNDIILPDGTHLLAQLFHNGQDDRITCVEKMIADQKLERCSWIFGSGIYPKEVNGEDEHPGMTTLFKEYIIDYRTMGLLPGEQAKALGYPKPSTISIDGEMAAEVITRFPKANRLSDPCYAFGFRHRVFASLKDVNPRVMNYIFVIWDNELYGNLADFSDEYGPTIYVYCKTELVLYVRLFEILIQLDPTWIIGFNQLGFDWAYIEQRCQIFGIKVPNMSRIRCWNKTNFISKTWKKFHSSWPQYPGRIDVDLLYIIRIQFHFANNTLKNIASEFFPNEKGKVELPYREQFKIFWAKDKFGMNKIMDYLLMDIKLPEMIFDKLSASVYLHTNGTVMKTNIMDLYTDGQSARAVNQVHGAAVARNIVIDRRTAVPSFKYIGGLVLDNKEGWHKYVMTFDFNSLYPSRMVADNICYTTIREAMKDYPGLTDDDFNVVEGDVPIIDKKTKEVIEIKHYRFEFVKKHIRLGLLPGIVIDLNKKRSEFKDEMAFCQKKVDEFKELVKKDPSEANKKMLEFWTMETEIWNVKQNAVKTSANSMYGFMGMKTGIYSFVEGAMATTIGGRNSLKSTFEIITKEFGANVIYGDTDSVMVQFPEHLINPTNYVEKVKEISDYITSKQKQGVRIVQENFFIFFISVTKKRYAGIKIIKNNPTHIPTMEEVFSMKLLYIRGLISVRGNSCGIVYKNFNQLLVMFLLGYHVVDILNYIHEMALKIMRRHYPLKDYTLIQKLGANYSKDSNEMAIFSNRLKQLGRNHKPGEELDFVYVRTYGSDCLKGYKMQAPDLFEENSNVLDTLYYLTNKIAKPVEQLLVRVYDDSIVPPSARRIIHPRKPTKVQKVTKVWHLQDYIKVYIAHWFRVWESVQNHIKVLRTIAEEKGLINYIIDEDRVKRLMKERYNIDWIPENDREKTLAAQNKLPLRRYN